MGKRSLLLLSLLGVTSAHAGNGHFLHGVGPVNSAMGGAGTALATDVMGALYINPALISELPGTQVSFATEFFEDDLTVKTSSPGASVSTDSDGDLGVIPAFAVSTHRGQSSISLGWGLLGVAGFRTDYPANPNSFLFAPQPLGFGPVSTDYIVAKIPFTIAWKPRDRVSFGASVVLYQAKLAASPVPSEIPDCFPQTTPLLEPNCFRPVTSGTDTQYAASLQLGISYRLNTRWSIGASCTSRQDYDPFEWNSTHGNPNITTGPSAFGTPRKVQFDLDGPPIYSIGAAFHGDKIRVAFDARWFGYEDTDGFGGTGSINENLQISDFGWKDIWAYMVGVEYVASTNVTLRGGININDSPIRSNRTFSSIGAPSVFEEHYSFGLSYRINRKAKLDVGAYIVPKNEISGPFLFPGSEVTIQNSIKSVQIGLTFKL